MTQFKYILILFFIFIFATSNVHSLNLKDTTAPKIDIVSPVNAQQYIISKPTIRATFQDENNIDLKSIKFLVNYKDVTKDCKIENNSISYKPKNKFKRGTQIIEVYVSDVNKNKSKAEWYFNVGSPNYNHYYGLIHAHTSNSDGHGSFEDAYYTSKFKAKLDFFAITDHSNMLDKDTEVTLDDGSLSSKWTSLINVSNDYTSNDKFLAIKGFEMTYPFKNKKDPIGHINVFNTNGFISTNDSLYSNLESFYKEISKHDDLIAQFNHPCDTFGRFNNLKYNKDADSVISLIEVCNGYKSDIDKNKIAFDEYQKALDLGWHLAPTSNQDNHRTDWGVANEFRTVVLCTGLNENSFYDSLRNMRVYATQDKNIKIDYSINDQVMGSTIKNTSNLYFNISVIDNDLKDKIKRIEVISNNGKIVAYKNFSSNLAKLELKLSTLKDSYYYVKVYQNNNKISVTAPIWIEFKKEQ